MNPQVPAVLFELAALLGRNAAPDVPAPERASDLGLSAMLLMVLGEVWDRQAHILVEENAATRALIGEAGHDGDLRLSSLQAENSRLRARLIALQVKAEADADEDLQRRIWAELVASTERRKIASAPI